MTFYCQLGEEKEELSYLTVEYDDNYRKIQLKSTPQQQMVREKMLNITNTDEVYHNYIPLLFDLLDRVSQSPHVYANIMPKIWSNTLGFQFYVDLVHFDHQDRVSSTETIVLG